MRLEDTIRYRLFSTYVPRYNSNTDSEDFVIECKADGNQSIPLCIHPSDARRADLIYMKLSTNSTEHITEKSTPRALYNFIFNSYYSSSSMMKLKLKDNMYFYSPGVLFNSNKEVLFYFAYNLDSYGTVKPRLYLTPVLLRDATLSGKPMERFFMSTIVPFLLENPIRTNTSAQNVVIEIDNSVDNTFFLPGCELIESLRTDQINQSLNDILANNADVLSMFTDIYQNVDQQ